MLATYLAFAVCAAFYTEQSPASDVLTTGQLSLAASRVAVPDKTLRGLVWTCDNLEH